MMKRGTTGSSAAKRFVTAALACLALLAAACTDEPTTGPTADDYKAERERLLAQMQKNKKAAPPKPAPMPTQQEPEGESVLGGYGAVAGTYSYDPRGRRDPFETYRYNADDKQAVIQTPLMAYELEQLSVVAVVWDTGNRRALVADPRGETHLVKEGSPIGKNDGLVIHIGDNMVLVKETYVDFAGDMTTKDVELRIRKSQGG